MTVYRLDTAKGFGLWLRSATLARCGALFFFIDKTFNTKYVQSQYFSLNKMYE
jgi:hypothetical protein